MGLKHGDRVDEWLRKHGGWFPDPQERSDLPSHVRNVENPKRSAQEAYELMQLVKPELVASGEGYDIDMLRDIDEWESLFQSSSLTKRCSSAAGALL